MEKLKVYLDTNMILDVFINQAHTVHGKEVPPPTKYKFMLQHIDKILFMTSILTKAEVLRELLTAYHCTKEQIEQFWDGFLSSLNCEYISEFVVSQPFLDIVEKINMKLRTMMNFQHVLIAMKEGAYFVTGDKDIVKKSAKTTSTATC